MGLGFQGKKMGAIWPLTSDFHIPASIKGSIKCPQVVQMDQDSAWKVQMGLGVQEKKIEAIQPLTSNFDLLVSIQICYLTTLGPSNPPKGVLLGLVSDCQQLASISQVQRQNSQFILLTCHRDKYSLLTFFHLP